MSKPDTITLIVRHHYAHSAERVFDAWLNPALARKFLFTTDDSEVIRCEIDARVGGEFVIVDRRENNLEILHRGAYLEINRPHRLVFTFQVPQFAPEEDTVWIEITPLKSGCELVLKTEIEKSALQQFPLDDVERAWKSIIAGLDPILSAQ